MLTSLQMPTPDDRAALKSYMHLFSRLYPCGECATEFQALLKQYPPQVSPCTSIFTRRVLTLATDVLTQICIAVVVPCP